MGKLFGLLTIALLLLLSTAAFAVPVLQLHPQDSYYDPVTESWAVVDSSPTLEVIGAVSPYWVHFVDEVKLYVSVPRSSWDPMGSITIQGLPSGTPSPDLVPTVYDRLGFGGRGPDGFGQPYYDPDGYYFWYEDYVPDNDIWPTVYWEIDLPDLMTETAGETVQSWDPNDLGTTDDGDIQYYSIEFMGFDQVHFDIAGVRNCVSRTVFDSCDVYAGGGDTPPDGSYIPEPATFILLGLGLTGLSAAKRRRRKRA